MNQVGNDYFAQLTEVAKLRRHVLAALDQTYIPHQRTKLNGELKELNARRTALELKRNDAMREVLYAKTPAQVGFRLEGGKKAFTPDQTARLEKGVEAFRRLVGPGHGVQGRTITVATDPAKSRSFFDNTHGNRMMIATHAPEAVTVHELGHWYEEQDSHGRHALRAFLKRRTTNADGTRQPLQRMKDLQPGRNYDEREVTRPDKFEHAYVGKHYATNSGFGGKEKLYATEVMSMGLQWMHEDPRHFALTDPDYFDTIWSILRAPRPA